MQEIKDDKAYALHYYELVLRDFRPTFESMTDGGAEYLEGGCVVEMFLGDRKRVMIKLTAEDYDGIIEFFQDLKDNKVVGYERK